MDMNDHLSLLYNTTLAINMAENYQQAIQEILSLVCRFRNWQVGHAYLVDREQNFVSSDVWYVEDEKYREFCVDKFLYHHEGIPGVVLKQMQVLWTNDHERDIPNFPRRPLVNKFGFKTIVAFPIYVKEAIAAIAEFFATKPEPPDQTFVKVLKQIGIQAGRSFERFQSTKDLQRREDVFRGILDSSPTAIIVIDQNSRILEWSAKCETTFGWTASEAKNEQLTCIIPSRFRTKHLEGIKRYLATKESHLIGKDPVILSAVHKDKSEFPVRLSINASTLPGDEPIFIGFVQDISEQTARQLKLEQSQRVIDNLQTTLKKVPAIVGLFRADKSLIFENEMLSQYVNKHLLDDDTFADAVNKLLTSPPGWAFKLEDFYDMEKNLYYDVTMTKVMINDSPHILLFAIDITDRIQAIEEKQATKLREESAIEKVRLKNEFLSNLSHEIRTPINGIAGMLDHLSKTRLDDEQREFVNTAQQSCLLLTSTVNQLLDISDIDSGRITTTAKPTHIGDVLKPIESMTRTACQQKGLQFLTKCDTGIEKLCLITDQEKLLQILTNIAANAVKFTEKGSVTLYAGSEAAPKRMLVMAFRDTGIGINDQDLPKLFTPFSQIDPSFTKKYAGTGLGLYLSQKYAKLLGGHIEVESEFGRGSKFTVKIPIQDCQERTLQEDQDFSRDLSGKKVLVVEDNIVNQKVLRRMLEQMGCKVDSAYNGLEAVNMYRNGKRYDIVLMDIQMPLMDGVTATREIRKYDPDVPIVAVTASMYSEWKRYEAAGMTAFLQKPYSSKSLYQTMVDQV